MYCEYYQARIVTQKGWFISGIFRNEDNLVFTRAVGGSSEKNTIEFFVPAGQEEDFLYLMKLLQKEGSIISFVKMQNRLQESVE